jgi:DNA-binding MarR family transcriptional regulator/archaellum biogenesis ATPase FlaH
MSTADRVLAFLQSYKLEKTKENQYRCNSPLRSDSNSHSFVVTVDPSGENGAFFDHVSEESGSLYELAQRLNIAIDRVAVETTKRQYNGIKDYAVTHGVTISTLEQWHWRETVYRNRPALVFDTRTGQRWRFLDGGKPTYISVSNYQRCWYGLEGAVQLSHETGQPLVICNGEISTVAAQYHGVAACCITGGEKAMIPHDLLTALQAAYRGQVLVAFDCLDKGAEAAPKIAAQLNEHGFVARAVDLGLGKGGDLADFCKLHSEHAVNRLSLLPSLQQAISLPSNQPRWRIIPASELQNLPPITWLIPGEVPAKGLTVVYGQSGVGKSFLTLGYALQIAQTDPVVYIAAEGEAGYKKRVAAWCKHHKLTEGKLYICVGAIETSNKAEVQQFITAIMRYQPKLVVIDTLARCMVGGDENNTRDMGLFINTCATIQTAINGAVLVVHHTGKDGKLERGSSALRAACDSMIFLSQSDEVIEVECSKSKDEEPFSTRYLRLLPVQLDNGTESRILVAADAIRQGKADPLSNRQLKVLYALTLSDFETGATVIDLARQTGLGDAHIRSIINTLSRFGYVDRRQLEGRSANLFWVTDAGKRKLQTDQGDQVSQKGVIRAINPVVMPADQGDQDSLNEISKPTVNRLADPLDRPDRVDHPDQVLQDSMFPQTNYYAAGL